MNAPRHEMILASAGSGKTYALTGRFVQLLAEGARPERIVALTFTRKAAGEFFDEILKKLAGAAADVDLARRLAAEIGRPEFGRERFLGLLRGVIEAMPRLRLGTLDSFFARIVRAFPLELGLAGEFELLQEHAAHQERRRVQRRMFARAGGLSDAQREFIEAFKRATFGREEKRLGEQLDAFLDDYQEIYLSAPAAEQWGDPARIWPDGQPWLPPPPKRGEFAAQLHRSLPWTNMNDAQRAKWEDFFLELEVWAPGADWGEAMSLILKNTMAVWPEVRKGSADVVVMRKRLSLDALACAALDALLKAIVGAELARRLETTRGIYAVVHGYEQTYQALVRRAGRLTFADVQRLLAPESGAPALSGEPGGERLFIDYRLDAEIDHWLLDEFQDTNHGQWSVLRNLVDEVVQDPEGRRSFFCVGDEKQAIYAWRGGDPRLFREIQRCYTAAAPGTIAMRHLDESWRSGPAIIAMVNRVFGDAVALSKLFPGAMSQTWNAGWRDHVSARPERVGQAAWLLAADDADRRISMMRVLRELRPLERGLTCAVLVQTNEAVAELTDFLRQEGGLPAVAESDQTIATDNPLGTAVLALVKAAAHPGDTLAWEHIGMTPFAAVLAQQGMLTPEDLTRRLLWQIHEDGFERTVANWVELVEPHLAPDDRFTRGRARQLVDAARLFDASGSRDAAEFLGFMARHTVREPEGAEVVRVMTVHKAKGLGFDVVILPDLEGTRLDQARAGPAVLKAQDRSIEWVLVPPSKLIAEQDTVLAHQAQEAAAAAGYEALSLLYVALTRAKYGLYLITKPPGDSTSRNFPRLLAATLGGGAEHPREVKLGVKRLSGAWVEGDPNWHEAVAVAPRSTPGPAPMRISDDRPGWQRFPALRPSARSARPAVARLFSLQGNDAAKFGTSVHRLLAQIEWGPAEHIFASWGHAGESADAVREAKAVLTAPALAEVWTRPVGPLSAEVWRERAFEMIWDQAWITGTMDRVVILRGPDGKAICATVYDFKTDRIEGGQLEALAQKHGNQLRLYRQAVCRLAGLPETAVNAGVVFTRLGRLIQSGL